MESYLRAAAAVAITCAIAVGCAAPPGGPGPAARVDGSPAISTALTCSELGAKLKDKARGSGGFEILWLEGHYSGRVKTSAVPAGWIKTVSQGIAAGCAIDVNASRPVMEIVAQVHRDYGAAAQAPAKTEDTSPPIATTATCGQLGAMLAPENKRDAGLTILWLEGYYSGRSGVTALPADWITTISQGVGGTCALDINGSRPVIDVIAQVHRDHGVAAGVR